MTEEQKKEIVLTKNSQPIKEISYQDMYLLNDTFDQIQLRRSKKEKR